MTFPSNVDVDPDPTTQIPWPARGPKRLRASSLEPSASVAGSSTVNDAAYDVTNGKGSNVHKDEGKSRMSTMDLIKLSISMAGAQVAWTVELGYVVFSPLSISK